MLRIIPCMSLILPVAIISSKCSSQIQIVVNCLFKNRFELIFLNVCVGYGHRKRKKEKK